MPVKPESTKSSLADYSSLVSNLKERRQVIIEDLHQNESARREEKGDVAIDEEIRVLNQF